MWSDDSKKIVFSITGADGIKLWVADAATGAAHKVTDVALNGIQAPCSWMDATDLICQTIPAGRGAAPAASGDSGGADRAGGRRTQESGADVRGSPLESAGREALRLLLRVAARDHLARRQRSRRSAARASTCAPSPSPDGKYVLVSTVHRPYSYQVPEARFPTLTEVWDRTGKPVRKVQDTPLQESAPRGMDAVEAGPRGVELARGCAGLARLGRGPRRRRHRDEGAEARSPPLALRAVRRHADRTDRGGIADRRRTRRHRSPGPRPTSRS